MPLVRRLRDHEWRAYRDLRLRSLRDSPDAFGSRFDQEKRRSDAEWAERVAAGTRSESVLPLVVPEEADFVGLAWAKIKSPDPDTARVSQMWVVPERRGRGLGFELLSTVVSWARDAKARRVVLRVTCDNTTARRLYVRAGFKDLGESEPLRPGASMRSQPMCLDL
jgi:ribosomal protein S18 acetylase RimI-like enzyme